MYVLHVLSLHYFLTILSQAQKLLWNFYFRRKDKVGIWLLDHKVVVGNLIVICSIWIFNFNNSTKLNFDRVGCNWIGYFKWKCIIEKLTNPTLKGQGINETLVHEGFAKFIDTDENLMNMLSSGEDTNKEFELLNRVTALNEDILNLDPNEEDPYKVRTILLRSWRLYEQLNTLIEDYKWIFFLL